LRYSERSLMPSWAALRQGCVACHGQPKQLAPGVQARLSRDYPHDKATGYLPGQLRGALSIERALE
jgi:hypothetical protein